MQPRTLFARRYLTVATVAFVLVSLASATSARAQGGSSRPIRFVITGGASVPQGDLKKFNDMGFHAAGSLLVNLFGLTLRPELSLTRLKQKLASTTVGGVPQPAAGESTQLLAAMGNVELPLFMGLYVLGGVGLQNIDAPATSSTSRTDSQMMVNAGAGFRFHLGPADGFLEARIGTASYTQGKLGYTKSQIIPISFGLAF